MAGVLLQQRETTFCTLCNTRIETGNTGELSSQFLKHQIFSAFKFRLTSSLVGMLGKFQTWSFGVELRCLCGQPGACRPVFDVCDCENISSC